MKFNNFNMFNKFLFVKLLIIIITINFGNISILSAELNQNSEVIFERGNENYKKQNYTEAINNYNLLIDNGIKNADLFFNLANSYYKNEEIGKSIVYYEKALLLRPSDEDIYFNLQIANLKTVDKFNTVGENPIIKEVNSIIYSFHSNTWVYLSILLFIIALTFVILLIISKNNIKSISLIMGIVSLTFFIILTFFAHYTYSNQTSNNFGVLILTNSYVKFTPDEKSDNLIMIHEGTKVEIIERTNNWTKIKLPDGNIGWLNYNNLMEI